MYNSSISLALKRLHDDAARLSQSQISAGAKSHVYIANVLANRRKRDAKFPWIVDTMLSGSYIRRTKPYPLDDIDMLVILDGTGLYEIRWGQPTSSEVRGIEAGSPIHEIIRNDGMICSRRLLDQFRTAIAETYPSSKVRKDGQAINVRLSNGIGMDIVPCFEILPPDLGREYFFIPAGNGSGWLSTNPRIDREISDNLHDIHNKCLRPVVRLVKLWNAERNAGRLKSYHAEVLVWQALGHQNPVFDIEDGLRRFFNFAPAAVLNTCPDPTGLGGPIDSYLNDVDRSATFEKLKKAREHLASNLFPLVNGLKSWETIFNRRLELVAV